MSDATNQGSVGLAIIRSPEYRITYADTFYLRTTGVDFTITFGVQNSVPSGQIRPVHAIIEQVAIATTLPLAKTLVINLKKAIQVIEEEIGPISIGASGVYPDEYFENLRQLLRSHPLITRKITDFDTPP